MFKYSQRYGELGFSDALVSMSDTRTRLEIMKAIGLLTRYMDIKQDTVLHEQFTSWLKRKELKWSVKSNINNYETARNLSPQFVIQSLKSLPERYRIFGLFVLSTGLRFEESLMAFNNHSKLCNEGIMELFWDRGNKKANAVFCYPSLHDRIIFTVSKAVYNHINWHSLGFDFRSLRKVNFTINASRVDPLLAEFMQGRRGNISQKHYFLPSMYEHQSKWLKAWAKLLG